jgi:branched-chain amino acid transport system ATP-binding protein
VTPALELRGLTAGYGGVPAVRGLDLHVGAGEVVALLGANGAGKSTTLLATSGLAERLAGDVVVLGRETRGMRPTAVARLGMAHVPEDRALFPSLTVAENLRVAGGRSRADLRRALEHFRAASSRCSRWRGRWSPSHVCCWSTR